MGRWMEGWVLDPVKWVSVPWERLTFWSHRFSLHPLILFFFVFLSVWSLKGNAFILISLSPIVRPWPQLAPALTLLSICQSNYRYKRQKCVIMYSQHWLAGLGRSALCTGWVGASLWHHSFCDHRWYCHPNPWWRNGRWMTSIGSKKASNDLQTSLSQCKSNWKSIFGTNNITLPAQKL